MTFLNPIKRVSVIEVIRLSTQWHRDGFQNTIELKQYFNVQGGIYEKREAAKKMNQKINLKS